MYNFLQIPPTFNLKSKATTNKKKQVLNTMGLNAVLFMRDDKL